MRKITAKRKRLLSALLAAALACLSACGNSAGTAGGSSQGEGGQAEPGYQGPLYQISFTKVTDRLPEFQDFTDSCVNLFSVNQYYGIELMTHFTQNDTIGIGTFQYCDGDYNYLPVGENRDFLAYHDGYRMFLWMPTNTIDREGWAIEVYDQDLNLVSTTADRFEGLSYGFAQLYLETGWLPLEEKATGLDGFFNVYTQEWRPLSASECLRTGGSYMNLVTCNSFYSDGLAYVTGADWAREYYAPTGLKNYEREVLGFLDESGQYAFRFEDLPEFDGLLVNMVTGFCDGTCIVAARYDDGAFSVPMPSEDAPYPFYQVDFVYEIDKTGKVLRQVDMDAFEAKEQEVIDRWGQMEVMEEEHTWNYYADSLRVADGLTLSVENPLPAGEIKSLSQVGGYTLTDANGNSYPLSGADPVRAIATDDGRIFLYCEKDPNTALAGSGDESAASEASSAVSETSSAASEALAADSAALTAEPDPLTDPADPNTDPALEDPAQQEGGLAVYQVEYEWIAPEGYQLPEDQKADLSGQGLMRYWDFQDLLLTGSIWMGGPTPENDPVMEVELYCEGTGFGEDTGPIQAQETARCSYRPAQEEYSTFTAGGEVLGQSWVVDLVYRLADPKFLDEAGNKSISWSGSCSWTDENGQTQTQELSIM